MKNIQLIVAYINKATVVFVFILESQIIDVSVNWSGVSSSRDRAIGSSVLRKANLNFLSCKSMYVFTRALNK